VKSSEGSSPHRRASNLFHAIALALAIIAVGFVRPGLMATHAKLRVKADDYLLPDPNVTLVGSLGYRAALADFIFGHVLVSHGLHFQEKRLFEHIGDYLDAINTLDPKFRDPYRFADTLLTLQPKTPPLEFYRKARQIQERGLKELPYDQELWTTAGQYMAYLAPGRLTDPAEQDDFRRAGARYLMHACDLMGSNDNLAFHCITAARLLSNDGDRPAAKRFLERALGMTDNQDLRDKILGYLRAMEGQEEQQRFVRRERIVHDAVVRDALTFAPRVELDALGPGFDTAVCAGLVTAATPRCATTWRRFTMLDAESAAAVSAAPQ
jgi:hypothetical protein